VGGPDNHQQAERPCTGSANTALPFAGSIEPTADLESIVASVLDSPHHNGISLAGGPADENDAGSALPVWIVSTGPACRRAAYQGR
jgi:hypothetical protein